MVSNLTPVGREESKKLNTLLQSLYDNADSEEFRSPVDFKGLGLKDYLEVIKKPMDLGTVKKNLKTNKYKYVEDCLSDIQVVWENCKQYNAEGSWIWKIADRLEKYTEKLIKTHFSGQSATKPKRTAIKDKTLNDTKTEDRATELDDQGENEETEQQSKIKLTQRLKGLSQEQLAIIIKTVQDDCPEACKEVEKDKFQVVVNDISKEVFQRIEEYVNECLEEPADQIVKKVKTEHK